MPLVWLKTLHRSSSSCNTTDHLHLHHAQNDKPSSEAHLPHFQDFSKLLMCKLATNDNLSTLDWLLKTSQKHAALNKAFHSPVSDRFSECQHYATISCFMIWTAEHQSVKPVLLKYQGVIKSPTTNFIYKSLRSWQTKFRSIFLCLYKQIFIPLPPTTFTLSSD